jgi:hypothetical protein
MVFESLAGAFCSIEVVHVRWHKLKADFFLCKETLKSNICFIFKALQLWYQPSIRKGSDKQFIVVYHFIVSPVLRGLCIDGVAIKII